jgi:hypothetical protein
VRLESVPDSGRSAVTAQAEEARCHTWKVARSWSGTAKYHRGWTGRDYHVTGGHVAEAKAAQEAEKPSRLGLWILRRLGYRGPDPTPPARLHITALLLTRGLAPPSRANDQEPYS